MWAKNFLHTHTHARTTHARAHTHTHTHIYNSTYKKAQSMGKMGPMLKNFTTRTHFPECSCFTWQACIVLSHTTTTTTRTLTFGSDYLTMMSVKVFKHSYMTSVTLVITHAQNEQGLQSDDEQMLSKSTVNKTPQQLKQKYIHNHSMQF